MTEDEFTKGMREIYTANTPPPLPTPARPPVKPDEPSGAWLILLIMFGPLLVLWIWRLLSNLTN